MSEVITMKRFLSLHIILGCFSWVSIFLHIYIVHSKKSITVPLSCFEDTFKTSYLYPDAYLKDFFVSTIIFLFLTLYVNLDLNFFEEFLNNCPITFDQTPFNMSPEWYFLPSFSVLKYVDNKIFGVIISSLFIFSIFVVLYFFEDDDNFF